MTEREDLAGLSDLAIVIVSARDAHWLERCLSTVFEHTGDATLEVIVVDNASTDGTREYVEANFPDVQVVVVPAPNRGFGRGNNRGLEQARARYVLMLNPDTEIVEGTFGDLVKLVDAMPDTGVVGVRQIQSDGTLCRSIHRFPTVSRAFGEALASERWPVSPAWSGERELDPKAYDREGECDWPTGAFMLLRREALLSAGLLDERFYLLCEEPDLCLRIKRAGWKVIYTPEMTIVHHAGKGGIKPRMVAQEAYSRSQYARKHFGRGYRGAYLAALGARYLIRALTPGGGDDGKARREGSRLAVRTLLGLQRPPFGPPPPTAIEPVPPAPRRPSQTPSEQDESALTR